MQGRCQATRFGGGAKADAGPGRPFCDDFALRRGFAMLRRFLDQRLNSPLLRVADALDTHGSLLKASAALGLGQPALTRAVRELEDITRTALFEQHPRGATPPRKRPTAETASGRPSTIARLVGTFLPT